MNDDVQVANLASRSSVHRRHKALERDYIVPETRLTEHVPAQLLIPVCRPQEDAASEQSRPFHREPNEIIPLESPYTLLNYETCTKIPPPQCGDRVCAALLAPVGAA